MTHLTGRSKAPPRQAPAVRRLPSVVSALLNGAVAAGLGLGVLSVVVLFLWITSPYADSGPSGALRIAADLWLLAHGADLVRLDTATGVPAPIGLTPLLLTALPLWLLYRFGILSLMPPDPDPDSGPDPDPDREPGGEPEPARRALGPPATVACLVAGYLLVALGALVHTSAGPVRSGPLVALAWLPAMAALAAGAGAWTACGRPRLRAPARLRGAIDRLSRWLPGTLPGDGAAVALRAAAAGVLTLVAGGALLTTGSLVWHTTQANASFAALTDAPAGRFAVLLLAATLIANAAVWAAAYALVPGFAVGAGTAVAPSGAHYAALPDFPLLAALPANGDGGPVSWAALAVPVAAGAAVALTVVKGGQDERHERWSAAGTALVAGLAALGAGCGTALLSAFASGPVGAHRLAVFGPAWPAIGLAALCWTFGLGVAGALALRRWRLREPPPDPAGAAERNQAAARGTGAWGRTAAREDRWAELKAASGGLMAPFPSMPQRGGRDGPAPPGRNCAGGGTATGDEDGSIDSIDSIDD